MKLGASDRFVILSLLPKEGDLSTIRIVHELKQALSFSEEEHEALQITVEDDGVSWKGEIGLKEVPIGPHAHVLIADTLKALSAEEKLVEEHLSLWERFVEDSKIQAV